MYGEATMPSVQIATGSFRPQSAHDLDALARSNTWTLLLYCAVLCCAVLDHSKLTCGELSEAERVLIHMGQCCLRLLGSDGQGQGFSKLCRTESFVL